MVEFYEEQLKELHKKIEDEKCREEWDQAAKKLRIFYDSMINAGFSEEQAWWFVTSAVREAWGIA